MADFNQKMIERFRAGGGKVEGWGDLVLLHHRGRKSGTPYVSPLVYTRDESDPSTIYIFASKGGAPTHPAWYRNLKDAGEARVEVGEETYDVDVDEIDGDARDRIFAAHAKRYPTFADYAEKTAGVRHIPVVALRRR